jgi:transposase
MNDIATVVGLDIAKMVFVAVGMNDRGKVLWKKKFARFDVLAFFATLTVVKIGIEACAGAHYWARQLIAQGHDAKLIAAQHVTPFVNGCKNDWNDAQAIAEIRSRGETKYVPVNTEAQQDMQMMHRARKALVIDRMGLICRVRAFAGEYGMVFPTGVAKFRKGVADWLANEGNGLSGGAVTTLRELLAQLDDKEMRVSEYDARISRAANDDERTRRLMEVPGIGKLTATAIVAAVADPHHFPNARDLSANLGLVPRQHSSGGKDRLYGITKRGDSYLRTLLIHCARAALRTAAEKPDRMLKWALQVQERRGIKVAAVALANKLARIAWALLANGGEYQPVPLRQAPVPGSGTAGG